MCCQILGMYVILDVVLKKGNRENDLRDKILAQVSFDLWKFWGTVSFYTVILLPTGSSGIMNILESCSNSL